MQAIDKFARARHPGIYKQDYIDALYNFFHERKPEFLVCPQTPEWKKSSDQDDDGAAHLEVRIVYTLEVIIGSPPPERGISKRNIGSRQMSINILLNEIDC